MCQHLPTGGCSRTCSRFFRIEFLCQSPVHLYVHNFEKNQTTFRIYPSTFKVRSTLDNWSLAIVYVLKCSSPLQQSCITLASSFLLTKDKNDWQISLAEGCDVNRRASYCRSLKKNTPINICNLENLLNNSRFSGRN
jgi:hypothetical protein